MKQENTIIKQIKGNIPINQELMNKYQNTSEIFRDFTNNYNEKVDIKGYIVEL